jgi:hypothetical protein
MRMVVEAGLLERVLYFADPERQSTGSPTPGTICSARS